MRVSGDLDIRSGGAIAVDTETLRRVAAGFAALTGRLDAIHADLAAERARLVGIDPAGTAWRFESVVRGAGWAADDATRLAAALRHAAAVYDIVDLRAQRDAARAAGDGVAAAAADARLRAIFHDHPVQYVEAAIAHMTWWLGGPNEMSRQAGTSPLGTVGAGTAAAMALVIALAARGRVTRDAVLTGPHVPVAISLIGGAATPGKAPASLTSVVDRIPRDEARVRVERYAMADGSTRFAVYVPGTRSVTDDREPWNWRSNLQLYAGERSASYEATVQALRDAGARPGDAIYEFGHSQGAIVASHLALEEGYDVQALVTFGSPVSADVGPDTVSVQVRHTDDPVVALADGGNPAGVGAEGSFIAERVADPIAGLHDIGLAAHELDEYRETAESVDESSDPRVGVLDDVFAQLGSAQSVEVFEYAATRIDADAGG